MYPGIDIIEISDLSGLAKGSTFAHGLFTPTELDFLKDKDISSYAARFAGKRLCSKLWAQAREPKLAGHRDFGGRIGPASSCSALSQFLLHQEWLENNYQFGS